MRYGMLVPVNYDQLAEFLLLKASDIHDPLDLSFESIYRYLDETATAMLCDPDHRTDEIEDIELTELLLKEHYFGCIEDVVVTKIPGIIVPVGDHLLKLPLVLIKI